MYQFKLQDRPGTWYLVPGTRYQFALPVCSTALVYTYKVICETYGIIPNKPSVYILCEVNDDTKNGLMKRPTYGKKKRHTKISCSIGKFHKVNYQPMLKNYKYHRMLLCLLGKHE